MSARDFNVGSSFPIEFIYFNFNHIRDEKCLIMLRSRLGLSIWLFLRTYLSTLMCAHPCLSSLTITDLEAILDGCLSVMDACMTRKMEIEGRTKKRRASLTSLSPDQFNDVVNSVFTTIYNEELETHNLVSNRRSKRLRVKSENDIRPEKQDE